MAKKSKLATVILSAFPGIGHLYLGWPQRGFLFALAFILLIALLDWTGLALLGLLMPVIWFYSLFDALQCYDQEPPGRTAGFAGCHWIFREQKLVGLCLIIVGGLILANKLAFPLLFKYLSYEVVRTGGFLLLALLFIGGGIRLAWGKPLPPPESPAGGSPGAGLPEEGYNPVEPPPPAETENGAPPPEYPGEGEQR